ncbi:flavonol reductase [Aspergillus eucalypticola CBS 122712]|uniref:Flavonol reductase n=1 Tax=Aspergillus eucalypticola (strain CBS 122712 / IBT 29274) TaxID=1448314 RepID=A0A317US05_ASPEC|nr:flavonol reductase [Aspergillus eucalypticola CBS 122712]PWY64803.1 flavonol reductase [Aspergillus eucalypticola CBS 122712]
MSAQRDQEILITGASGFVATHVIKSFLEHGYRVRGTVRSEQSAANVRGIFSQYSDRLSFAIVKDIAQPGAFEEAVKEVDGIIHTASPVKSVVEDQEKDLLQPAIRGTLEILQAAQAHSRITRVVITSSFAAMANLYKGLWPEHTYTEADWNPETYENARTADGVSAYCASKAFAEKAAWDFMEKEKPHFSLATICPPMIYGPVEQCVQDMSKLNTSAADIYRLMNGSITEVPVMGFPAWADVRDVADAHLRAFQINEAMNERFFITSGNYNYQEVCEILRASFPQIKDKVPHSQIGQTQPAVYKVSNQKAQSVLGMQFRSLESSIKDTAESLLTLKKKLEN